MVQLSDIHVGPRVDDDYVTNVFARVAALRPDIVVLTGDLTSYHEHVFEQMERVYQQFPKGRMATLGILGNHDYGPGWSHPEIAERVAAIATGCGITILRNQVHDIDGLQIVGFDDFGRNASILPLRCAIATIAGLRSRSVTIPTPSIFRAGIASRAGSSRATPMVVNANRRSFRRHSCRFEIGGTRRASSTSMAIARCTSIEALVISSRCVSMSGRR